jgi:Tetracyclin repressor-like, C-terminal domain
LDAGEPVDDAVLEKELAAWARDRGVPDADAGRALAAVTVWSRLHGIVSLEIEGNFASMRLDADRLFAREVSALSSGR